MWTLGKPWDKDFWSPCLKKSCQLRTSTKCRVSKLKQNNQNKSKQIKQKELAKHSTAKQTNNRKTIIQGLKQKGKINMPLAEFF